MITELVPERAAKPVHVVIADDHELARAGLRGLLEGESELQMVGEASNGREAVEVCTKLRPDLVLMDVRMPEMDGLEATRAIKKVCPQTSIIIVTMHENPEYLIAAIRAGAAGYLIKNTSRRELIAAIHQVLQSESFLNTELTRQLLHRLASETRTTDKLIPDPLTPREMEVLKLLTQGQTNREIAQNLVISTGTVKVHVEHIIAKLKVSDRTQAAVRSVELGLIR